MALLTWLLLTIHLIPINTNTVDGSKFLPGDTVCIQTGTTPLRFINVIGTKNKPILITSCGTRATLTIPIKLSYGIKFEGCKFFRLSKVTVIGGNISVSFDKLTTEFEADNNDIGFSGFAGMMGKTDPTYPEAMRGKFIMRGISIHNNYVHDTGGEGLYIGNSFYSDGKAHIIEDISIYSNRVERTGWEAIQVGSAVKGVAIFNNVITDYGLANKDGQNNGIQIGEGTGGVCCGNTVSRGNGNGIIILGLGSIVANNEIYFAGANGIFCDDRPSTLAGFTIVNNVIINPKQDGIRLYADKAGTINIVDGNTVSGYGGYSLNVLSQAVKVAPGTNYFIK